MKLTDIVESFISGDWGNDSVSEENSCRVFCIRGADIEPIKTQNYNQIPQRYISQRSYENKLLHAGDIIIEKSGGSPSQSTGRVCIITQKLIEEKGSIVCSNFCVAFRVKANWNAEYVYLFLQHIYNAGVFFNFEGKTSGIKNLQLEQAFKSITIKPIPLNQQEVLANVILNFDNKIAVNRAINRNLPLAA
jgi:type I restriction enzyme S subunit